MEAIQMCDLLVTEATKPNRRDLVKQWTERRFWKRTLGSVLCVLLTLFAVGLFCWAINNRMQTHSDVDTVNNRTIRQSMCEQFEPGCKPDPEPSDPEPSDPEPSDPGSSDKGASPDGSSCEMFELGCLNPRSSDTKQPEEPMQPKQPEEPKQPEVAETETVPMEPLSNTSKKNLLMKWMTWAQSYVTYVRANSFIWLNESAAMPYISEWNWQMATTALELMAELYSPSSTNSTWSLEEKRVYAHWADYWVLQPKLGEYNTTELVLKFRLQNWVETIRTQFDQLQLQFNAAS